jgi:hypothetical protein
VNANQADSFTAKEFKRSYADALVYITSQKNEGDYTKYTLAVEKYDEDDEVTGFHLYSDVDCGEELVADGL